MKHISKIVIVALLTISSTLSFAQEVAAPKVLDSMALRMFEDVNNKNFESIIEMTHPKVFDIVPKDMMISVFKTMFEGNNEYKIEIPNIIPEHTISSVFNDKDSKTDFAFLSYDMKMKMTFLGQEFEDDEKEMMVNMMKIQDMHVKFISDSTLDVLMKNRVTILLKNEDTDNKWSMINYDKESPLLFQLLPTGVIEKAKEYSQDLMLETKKKEEKN